MDRNSDVFVVFVFRGHKLLRASLKVPALTGYVGDAQSISLFASVFCPMRSVLAKTKSGASGVPQS